MSSEPLGISTSEVEVTGISAHGVWLLAGEEEIFLSYEDFPWFKDVSVREILNVQGNYSGRLSTARPARAI